MGRLWNSFNNYWKFYFFILLFRQASKDQVGPYAPEIVAKEKREDSLQKAKQIENLKKIYGEDKK